MWIHRSFEIKCNNQTSSQREKMGFAVSHPLQSDKSSVFDTNYHDNTTANSIRLIDIRGSNPIKDFCKYHRLASEISTIRDSPTLEQHDLDAYYNDIICKRTSWGIGPDMISFLHYQFFRF